MATGIFGSRAISAQESQARTLSITQGQVLGSWDWPMADAINAEADEEYDDDEVLEEDKEDETGGCYVFDMDLCTLSTYKKPP